jgi:hypothetical protein
MTKRTRRSLQDNIPEKDYELYYMFAVHHGVTVSRARGLSDCSGRGNREMDLT